ncbi:MAG: serine hydrolase [Chloroflexi bacterium]|nr:serine hydrolase [Chloroflexota bacterium]
MSHSAFPQAGHLLHLSGVSAVRRRVAFWWGLALAAALVLAGLPSARFSSTAGVPDWGTLAGDVARSGAGEPSQQADHAVSSAPPTPAAPVPVEAVPYPGTYLIHPLATLAPEAARYLDGRQGTVAVAVYDGLDGNRYGHQSLVRLRSASIIKVAIMAALLDRVQRQGRSVSPQEHRLLSAMIQWSDNAATTALLRRAGGPPAVQEYLRRIGLTHTQVNPSAWGYTLTTASDMVRLVAQLYFQQILTPELCQYALDLMRGVTPAQRWGITGGLPASASVALKNGWYPENDDGSNWRVHSIGAVEAGDRAYIIAVLTRYPQELGMAYGQETIAGVAQRIYRAVRAQER